MAKDVMKKYNQPGIKFFKNKYFPPSYRSKPTRDNIQDRRLARLEQNVAAKEKKFKDASYSGGIGTTGSIGLLTGILQGTDNDERIGTKIKPLAMQYKVWANQNGSATAIQKIRVIIFIDKQPNATAPTAALLLEGDNTYSWKNRDNSHRFRILRDMMFCLSDNPNASGSTQFQKGIIRFPRWFMCHYNDTGSTVASAYLNHVFYYVVSDDNTNQPPYRIETRLRYLDA